MTNMEPNTQPPSDPGPGTPPVVEPVDPGPSPDLTALQQEVERLQSNVSGLQSAQDKGLSEFNTRLDGFDAKLDRYDQLIADGFSPTQARRELAVDDLIASRNGQTSQPVDPAPVGEANQPAQPPQANPLDLSGMIKAVGLDANDTQVIELIRQHGANPSRLSEALINHKMGLASNPAPAASVAAPQGGSDLGGTGDVSELITQANKELAALPRGAESARQRAVILDKYHKAGVPVGSI